MSNHNNSPTNRNVNLTIIVHTYACLGVLYKHLNCIIKSKPLSKRQNQTKSSSLFEREGLHAIYYVSEQLKKKTTLAVKFVMIEREYDTQMLHISSIFVFILYIYTNILFDASGGIYYSPKSMLLYFLNWYMHTRYMNGETYKT